MGEVGRFLFSQGTGPDPAFSCEDNLMNPPKCFPVNMLRQLPAILAVLLLLSGCSPAKTSDPELRQEIQGLKADLAALKEAMARLEGGQQAILEVLKKSGPVAEPQALPPQAAPLPEPAPGPQALTVSQLIAGKDRYLGSRVVVKGNVGPVLVHHKSLLLVSPEGMVEVFLDKLPDQKVMQRLTSAPFEGPVTVTGTVGLPGKSGGGAKLQINAEAVEF
jgi:hypothetical protein